MYSKLAVFAAVIATANAECVNSCTGHGQCTIYKAEYATYPRARNALPATSSVTGAAIGTGSLNSLGYDTKIPMKDSCTCFTRPGFMGDAVYAWTGADCSLKTCPYGLSWNGPALAHDVDGTMRLDTVNVQADQHGNFFYECANAQSCQASDIPAETASTSATPGGRRLWYSAMHTQRAECSNMGLCNRKTGACECFDGYTGESCQRSSCPNDCSGAGKCTQVWQIVEDVSENAAYYGEYVNLLSYVAFDKNQLRGCVCDAGRSGPDCSLVDCPSGADPLGGQGGEHGRVCSSRGNCNFDTGECECYGGYFGTACETQRNMAV